MVTYYNPECSACGRKLKDDEEFRVDYFVNIGRTLCQNPSYRKGESDDPGCMDRIWEAAREWIESQGQQELGEFLG